MTSKVKLETKFIGAFVFVVLICAVIGVTSLINIRKMAKADQRLYDDATVRPLTETWIERLSNPAKVQDIRGLAGVRIPGMAVAVKRSNDKQ